MGNISNGDILKLNIGLFVISTVIMMLVTKLRKLFTKNKKRAIIYAIIILATFALTGLLSSSKVLNDTPLNSFYGFEFIFFGLGILHLYILRKYFPALSEDKSEFFPEFLFTLAYVSLGLIAFLQVVNRFRSPFSYVFISSALLFVIPTLVFKMYEFAMLIPVPIYKIWLFPLNKDIKDPTIAELAHPRVISFEFRKKEIESDITNFKVKAPINMEFGKLFYFFIIDYNAREPGNNIETLDEKTQQPCGWVFHFKPNWWSPLQHIDFSNTIAANHIKEDSVIICRRVEHTKDLFLEKT